MTAPQLHRLDRLERLLNLIFGVLLITAFATSEVASGAEARQPASKAAAQKQVVVESVKDRSEPAGPKIRLLGVDRQSNDVNSASIGMQFIASGDASINHDSIRVRYGLVGIDVTERVRKYIDIRDDKILLSGSVLPLGTHRLSIEISDSKQRKSAIRMRFKVLNLTVEA